MIKGKKLRIERGQFMTNVFFFCPPGIFLSIPPFEVDGFQPLHALELPGFFPSTSAKVPPLWREWSAVRWALWSGHRRSEVWTPGQRAFSPLPGCGRHVLCGMTHCRPAKRF